MERNQSKPTSGKSSDKKGMAFLESLITKYFKHQSEKDSDYHIEDPSFNKSEVYNKVLSGIGEKERKSRLLIHLLRIAASVLLIFSLATVLYIKNDDISGWVNPVKMVETKSSKGQTVLVRLQDGSRVWLNADSKLTYPEHFDGKKRELQLVGEAYFEVVHLEKQPFIIRSGDVKTVVLGTTFNIKAYPNNEKVEVTVLTGKVAVVTPSGEKETLKTVFVTSNQKASYVGDEIELQTSSVKAKETISWKEGKMVFHNTPLLEAVAEVERKYNIQLNCSDKIKDCTVTTTADLNNEGLDKVLKVMATMVNGAVSYHNGVYHLEGKGCD
ncbi:FecR family protein [Desertivirga brevis]|uniref:FecR family protein n=1 Tax=Desertivirga brevis TaxID=2810310 RepID=UPI001A966AFC|nr:FecR domain-containing protein [Pedobacter sp. SYSU D00873]